MNENDGADKRKWAVIGFGVVAALVFMVLIVIFLFHLDPFFIVYPR